MSPGMRMARPGPGNGWRLTQVGGRPSSRPSSRTSSLNSSRSGSTSFMFMRSGRPPTLWWILMVTLGPPVKETDLDHVGIERALGEELGAADLLGLGLEHVDEQRADRLALGLGVGDAVERLQELSPRRRRGPAGCCSGRGTGATTCSPSPSRSRPWSTNTHCSWSPIASCSSTATTDESTPPDRPQITLPLPTWARIWAMARS